jgi:DNA-binding NarL/FixJ family response regulator
MINMRVILADDSALILARLQDALSSYTNVEILGSFKNGTEALDAIKTLRPDLAIIDIKMPGLSGLEVLIEVRKEDRKIKIIIITFYSSDYYEKLARQLGADYFFSKVDDFEKVSEVVAQLASGNEYPF